MTLYVTTPWDHVSHRSTHFPALLLHMDQRPFCAIPDIHRQVSFRAALPYSAATPTVSHGFGRLRDRSMVSGQFPITSHRSSVSPLFLTFLSARNAASPRYDWHARSALGCPRTSALLFTSFLIRLALGLRERSHFFTSGTSITTCFQAHGFSHTLAVYPSDLGKPYHRSG